MNYYSYELIRESDLTHHGIKGQKWGVRRFQNEDGSLTSAGLRRQKRQENRESYRRGREIAKDRDRIYDEKLNNLRESSNEYKSNKKRLDELEYIYDLDEQGRRTNPNSPRGPLYEIATTVAESSHNRHSKQLDAVDTQLKEKARKYTEKKLLAKHGESYVKDLNRYDSTNAGIAAVSTVMLTAGFLAIAALANKR